MSPSDKAEAAAALVCVDAGTTHTRVWRLAGERVVARAEAAVGARDAALDGHNGTLTASLRALIGTVMSKRGAPAPSRIAAAGMITSAQGLVEVPHLAAPAGIEELRRARREVVVSEVSELPFVFVPGVRTTARPGADAGILGSDVMRGEETLCVGLLRLGRLAAGEALLSIGSHWKLIRLDERGRVAWSVTSLSGELLHAIRAQTILASALPKGPLAIAGRAELLAGMQEVRRSGLPRALFCVRLLEQARGGGPAERLSFLLGALVASDLDAWRRSGCLPEGTRVRISGGEKAGGAWSLALSEAGCPSEEVSAADVEAGLLTGLRAIVCGAAEDPVSH